MFWLLHFSIRIYQTQNVNFSWLAEPDDGPGDNYWIVNKLLEKFPDKMTKGEELEGPHYEDQWWIGARSYVSYDWYFCLLLLSNLTFL